MARYRSCSTKHLREILADLPARADFNLCFFHEHLYGETYHLLQEKEAVEVQEGEDASSKIEN